MEKELEFVVISDEEFQSDGELAGCADTQCLEDSRWLDDEVIRSYLKLLKNSASGHPNSIQIVDSLFMEKLSACGYDGVKSWMREWTALQEEIVLFVINVESSHWTLMLGEPQTKVMTYYDSLGGKGTQAFHQISEFLQKRFQSTGWHLQYPQNIPKQKNSYDCGVFVCQYARCLIFHRPMTFSQDFMPQIRERISTELQSGVLLASYPDLPRFRFTAG